MAKTKERTRLAGGASGTPRASARAATKSGSSLRRGGGAPPCASAHAWRAVCARARRPGRQPARGGGARPGADRRKAALVPPLKATPRAACASLALPASTPRGPRKRRRRRMQGAGHARAVQVLVQLDVGQRARDEQRALPPLAAHALQPAPLGGHRGRPQRGGSTARHRSATADGHAAGRAQARESLASGQVRPACE